MHGQGISSIAREMTHAMKTTRRHTLGAAEDDSLGGRALRQGPLGLRVEVPVRILAPRGGLLFCEERPLVHASVNLRDGDGGESSWYVPSFRWSFSRFLSIVASKASPFIQYLYCALQADDRLGEILEGLAKECPREHVAEDSPDDVQVVHHIGQLHPVRKDPVEAGYVRVHSGVE
jgi:hypothetical protein